MPTKEQLPPDQGERIKTGIMDKTSPAWRRERAVNAGKKAHSLDVYIRSIVARAPELRPEHIEQLRALLPPDAADDGRAR